MKRTYYAEQMPVTSGQTYGTDSDCQSGGTGLLVNKDRKVGACVAAAESEESGPVSPCDWNR